MCLYMGAKATRRFLLDVGPGGRSDFLRPLTNSEGIHPALVTTTIMTVKK